MMIELLDFFAEWCPPCKTMGPIFEELKEEFAGKVEFRKIDIDKEGEKAAEFKVMSVPTFVILKDGKEASRKVGALSRAAFKSWIEENLS